MGSEPMKKANKAAVSMTEMARMCDLSRQRFYQLIGRAFPYPLYDVATRRPFYRTFRTCRFDYRRITDAFASSVIDRSLMVQFRTIWRSVCGAVTIA
jgi:hypothetical protein